MGLDVSMAALTAILAKAEAGSSARARANISWARFKVTLNFFGRDFIG